MKNLLKSIAAAFACAIVLIACSNSRLTSSWTPANTSTLSTSNKILVLGIIHQKDDRLRMQMEGWMVDALKAKGYNAVSAYTLYGPKMFDNKDEEAVVSQFRNGGFNDVFTIALVNRNRRRHYVPGTFYPYGPFWGYYNYMYGAAYSPGYLEVTTHFFWESHLYDVQTKALLYSAQSRSTDPASASDMGHDNSAAVVKDMVKKGIIAK